jgi:hypothetical protein
VIPALPKMLDADAAPKPSKASKAAKTASAAKAASPVKNAAKAASPESIAYLRTLAVALQGAN